MPLSRTCFVTVFVVLAVSATAQAQLRNWLDADGKTIRGEYEGIQDGNVVIRTSDQRKRIHFYALSEADQQHLRKQLEAAGKDDLIPRIGEFRTWTDNSGTTVEGQLLGKDQRFAYVLVGSKQQLLPLDELSPADRAHVETTLRQWGMASKPTGSDRPIADRENPRLSGSDDEEPPETNGPPPEPVAVVEADPMEPRESDSPAEAPPRANPPRNGRSGWIPPSPQGHRPAYVPPSNKAAALAQETLPSTTTIVTTGSGGSIYPMLVVLLAVAAVAALVLRYMSQRAG